ncbi:GNAT family N-acetyltransferase [Natranaeroarchaeum aerophilus]|uniref:GNAT family N-acetyltransferase n=1 Tax=Natranaeroarchaeum aerophilus TaxID=2917711 RepID=A0AAE3FR53_9EURY|nr:GNAT family N-acetyltransferase [Natranaeroarchaeum aerophilus]MCL9813585.1 GNAT family N-acetyltransferase [Natranaeroarchaeum aerophilus]
MGVRIRPARREDIPTIQRVVSDSWRAAYADLLSPDALSFIGDEERFLPADSLEQAMDTDELWFLVAIVDGAVIGEVQFATGPETHSFVAPDEGETQLQSLYIDPDHWRAGVGSELVEAGIERLQGDTDAVLVEVLSDNTGGRKFYRSEGFDPVDERVVELFSLPYPSTIMRRPIA